MPRPAAYAQHATGTASRTHGQQALLTRQPTSHARRRQNGRPSGARRTKSSTRRTNASDAVSNARPSARQRGYTTRWDRARRVYLAAHPLCRMCEQDGRTTPATVVDHVVPHRGDARLFWDSANWQPLCAHHHNSVKQRQERQDAVGVDGAPMGGWMRE